MDKKEVINEIFLHTSPYCENSERLFDTANKIYFDSGRGVSEKSLFF